uniref:Uncharacterized protein n=1 Tax=Meloidogyne enterolobii TaxID=390850 RepID=A0A6V7XCC2_MELEN|nr:unnamed protein product [Meloidogyne enterolobii]
MDQHIADKAICELNGSVKRFSRQIIMLEGVKQESKELKNNLYNAFMRHHERRYPLISTSRVHEYLLKERNALARIAVTEVVKDELYHELQNPLSKFWQQIDLESAINICYFDTDLGKIVPPEDKESPIIFMNNQLSTTLKVIEEDEEPEEELSKSKEFNKEEKAETSV